MANTIQISVLGDVKGFQKSMQQVQRDLGTLGKASARAGSVVKGSLKAVGVGLLAIGAGVAKFSADSIKVASDAQQSIGATEAIFGKHSKTVQKYAYDAANAYGLSANEYREGANLLGALFKNQGVQMNDLAGETDKLMKRAGDLAAMYGGNVSLAVEAMTAAYKGEYNQLEKYGITLNQTMVNEEMRRRGLDNLTGAQKRQAEQQVKTDLIMKQSADAQGAAARESNTYAAMVQRLSAKFTNFQERVGTVLIPILEKLMTVFEAKALPALERFASWFEANGPAAIDTLVQKFNAFLPTLINFGTFIKDNAKTIGILVAGFYAITTAIAIINPLVTAAIGIWKAMKAVMVAVKAVQLALNILWFANPIGLVIAAIAALVAIFVIAYKKSETFRRVVDAAWAGIKKATVAVWNFLKSITLSTWNAIKGAATKAASGIKSGVSSAWNAIKSVTSSVFNSVKSFIVNAWNAAKSATTSAWSAMKSAVNSGVQSVLGFIRGLPGQIQGFFAGAGSWLLSAGRNIIQGLLDGISGMIGSVKSKLGELTNMIPDWKGPAKRDKKLLRPVGRMIIQGLVDGFDDGRKGMKTKLGQITKDIEKALRKGGLNKKQAAKQAKVAERWFKANQRVLLRYSGQVTKAAKKVEKAEERLADIRKERYDYKQNIVNKMLDYGSLGNLNSAFTADAMLQQMKARIDKVKQYNALLKDLIAKGLNKDMVDQLAQAGVEGGMAYAQAISQGGPDAIKEFNSLQGELKSAANVTGNVTADNMYRAGIQAAQGLLQGLRSKERELRKQASRFANMLSQAVKKALKIKSPSRVFKDIGAYTVAGLAAGLADNRQLMNVQRAAGGMTGRIEKGFEQPRLALDATHASNRAGGDTINLNINVPATADKAAIGREITQAIAAYYRQGGRRVNL